VVANTTESHVAQIRSVGADLSADAVRSHPRRCYAGLQTQRQKNENSHTRLRSLDDEHRVAIAIEPVRVRDRFPVRVEDALAAGECGDGHQER
jgi:hypothetical protein